MVLLSDQIFFALLWTPQNVYVSMRHTVQRWTAVCNASPMFTMFIHIVCLELVIRTINDAEVKLPELTIFIHQTNWFLFASHLWKDKCPGRQSSWILSVVWTVDATCETDWTPTTKLHYMDSCYYEVSGVCVLELLVWTNIRVSVLCFDPTKRWTCKRQGFPWYCFYKINAAAMALASDLCNMDELCATSGLHLRGRLTGCLVGRMATTRRFGHSTPGSDRTRSLSFRCFHPEDSSGQAQFPGLGHWCRGVPVEHPVGGGGCHLRFSSHQFAKLFFDRWSREGRGLLFVPGWPVLWQTFYSWTMLPREATSFCGDDRWRCDQCGRCRLGKNVSCLKWLSCYSGAGVERPLSKTNSKVWQFVWTQPAALEFPGQQPWMPYKDKTILRQGISCLLAMNACFEQVWNML